MRYHINITKELQEKIEIEMKKTGLSYVTVINEKLEQAFGVKNEVVLSDVLKNVCCDVEQYIKEYLKNPEELRKDFTLYEASETFKSISKIENKNQVSTTRIKLGKSFKKLLENGKIVGISPYIIGGKQKRRNNATIYLIHEK